LEGGGGGGGGGGGWGGGGLGSPWVRGGCNKGVLIRICLGWCSGPTCPGSANVLGIRVQDSVCCPRGKDGGWKGSLEKGGKERSLTIFSTAVLKLTYEEGFTRDQKSRPDNAGEPLSTIRELLHKDFESTDAGGIRRGNFYMGIV